MNKTYITLIVLVLVAGGLFFALNSKKLEAPTVEDNKNINVYDNIDTSSGEIQTIVEPRSVPFSPPKENTVGVVREFTITGQNFSFAPSLISVRKGDKVKITFNNTEGFHDFKIDKYGLATKQTKSPSQEVLEFTADKVGSFEYYCSVGTHRSMGMKGTLKVE